MPRAVPATRAVISATRIHEQDRKHAEILSRLGQKVPVGAHDGRGVSRVKKPTQSINDLSKPSFDAP